MAKGKKTDRKTTIFGALIHMTEKMKQEVDLFMYDYSFMFRFAFKRLLEIEREDLKKVIQQLEKDLSARTGYPIRVAKDAVADVNELLKDRHALIKEYYELWKERYEHTKSKVREIKKHSKCKT